MPLVLYVCMDAIGFGLEILMQLVSGEKKTGMTPLILRVNYQATKHSEEQTADYYSG